MADGSARGKMQKGRAIVAEATCLVGFCDNAASRRSSGLIFCDVHDKTVHPYDRTFRLTTLEWVVVAPQWWSNDESDAALVLLDELRTRIEVALLDGLDEISGELSIRQA